MRLTKAYWAGNKAKTYKTKRKAANSSLVRSFFSVFLGVFFGKIYLQNCFKRVFVDFHCGAQGNANVYARSRTAQGNPNACSACEWMGFNSP